MKIIELSKMKMTEMSDDGKVVSDTRDRKQIRAALAEIAKGMNMTVSELKKKLFGPHFSHGKSEENGS